MKQTNNPTHPLHFSLSFSKQASTPAFLLLKLKETILQYLTMSMSMSIWQWLPKEIITEILSWLPVKSLIRFRCVSKAWCSLISTSRFIATHLNHSLSNSQHQTYIFACHNYTFHTLLLYPSYQEIEQKGDFFANPSDLIELHDPFNHKYSLYLVGSSNGLLCLANMTFNNESGLCVLWNPSIQKAISLPKPNLGSLQQTFGFGYEPVTDDYKLVRLMNLHDCKTVPPLFEIYTLRTGIWRFITAPDSRYTMKYWSSSVLVCGALHWSTHTQRHQGAFCNVIMSFNMKDETFGEVGMPKSLQELEGLDVTVALIDGLLALVPRTGFGIEASHAVWVMKEYGVVESWTKLYDVRIEGFQRVIGFPKSDEVLVHDANRFFSFGPSSRGYLEDLPLCGLEHIYLDAYVESLVLLNVADLVPGRQGNSSGGS
ncbi:F-box/kelch-repeat protein At3g06240-like [Corylus avellana]|uniref:F-box/kelch-repeat protein At3g06240-like n=1 Tax=Corylus avellana TaxID=13451 RepID=UPI00286CC4E1|nr:F-box/kelch-repeat protein At3g06240-like [Corylus avellana]XP_059451986.1 F-box/kelch-repeat protein At3g06240-like [Corylus avellana]